MKARVKATGEIVEVTYTSNLGINTDKGFFLIEELEGVDYELDYWTRLEHQYAGMAMQQLVHLVNVSYEYAYEETAIIAMNFAHALVKKLKEKEE
jgi:hypothetical protein